MNFRKGLMMALAGLLVACHMEDDLQVVDTGLVDLQSIGKVQLGKKLQNPYSVANMELAWENLKKQRPEWANESLDITATHRYFKFMPQDEAELETLSFEYDFDLYDYPLDYEVIAFNDQIAPAHLDIPLPQYCAIPIDQEFPAYIQHEVLAELFIPDEHQDGKTAARVASAALIDDLVNEALRITDNLPELSEGEKGALGRTANDDWRPSGRIRVWDHGAGTTVLPVQVISHYETYICPSTPTLEGGDGFGGAGPLPQGQQCRRPVYRTENQTFTGRYVGVEDLEVKARRWFTTYSAKTNFEGEFTCDGTFKNPATYSIKWHKYHFSVRAGEFIQAGKDSDEMDHAWYMDFGRPENATVVDKQQYYALIFQAARDYYYGFRFGLHAPPLNSGSTPQMKIAAITKHTEKDSFAALWKRTGGILSSLHLREWDRTSDRVYGTTIHELAHAAHWDLDRDNLRYLTVKRADPWNGEPYAAVMESWARGVEWRLTQHRYEDRLNVSNYRYRLNMQTIQTADERIYTSLVVDLMDDHNQREFFATLGPDRGDPYPQDRVSGYSIAQIENSLDGASSWNEWRDKLKSEHDNLTEDFVDELFANWH